MYAVIGWIALLIAFGKTRWEADGTGALDTLYLPPRYATPTSRPAIRPAPPVAPPRPPGRRPAPPRAVAAPQRSDLGPVDAPA
jgi:hypothetical protein